MATQAQINANRQNSERSTEPEAAVEQQSASQMASPADRSVGVKKQSQFAPDLMDLNSFVRKDYENNTRPESEGNKANQSQFYELTCLAGQENGGQACRGRNVMT